MKYHCIDCNIEFNESDENKKIKSSLTRSLILKCPNCNSHSINLSEQGILLIERKAKIEKIEKSS